MKKIIATLALLTLALLCTSVETKAQDMDARAIANNFAALQENAGNPFAGEQELDENGNPIEQPNNADSTRVKEIMPLESYFFDDSIRRRKHFRWVPDTYTNNIRMEQVDTLIGDFNRDYVFQREDVGDANVGILGGVSTPLNFFRRPKGNNFDFTDGYYAYLFTIENTPHYNNKRPFTTLAYQTAGQKRYAEDKLEVVHAQNVTPSTGFNVRYNNYHSRGIYTWQRGKVDDFSAALSHTGKRYSLHAGVISNTISQRENGGLVEAWHVSDTIYESPQGMPMKLSDALNKATNTALYAVQTYGIPFVPLSDSVFTMADRTAIHFGHAITYNRWGKRYSDTRRGTQYNITDRDTGKVLETLNFYDHWYIDPDKSSDTLSESLLSNRLFVQFVPYNREGVVGTIDGGLGWDHHEYYQFQPQDYLTGRKTEKFNTYYAYADARGKLGKWLDWQGRARVNVAGYRAGDIDFDAAATLRLFLGDKPLTLTGELSYDLQSPSYWEEHYFSNHFVWENKFQRQNITELKASLQVPHTGTKLTFNQALIGNPIYYGTDSTPAQTIGIESVTGLYLEQNFAFGGLHLDHRILLQHSSSEIFPVPLLSGNISYYYVFQPVKNVLTLKVGVDCWANTPYYAQAYNPALMVFHNQDHTLIGNYPYANLFVAAKWKTMRIFVQYQHATENLLDNYTDSFSVPFYPYNRAVIKYGVCWYFDN